MKSHNDVLTLQDEDFNRSRTYQIDLHFRHLDSLNVHSLHPFNLCFKSLTWTWSIENRFCHCLTHIHILQCDN